MRNIGERVDESVTKDRRRLVNKRVDRRGV